MTEQPKTDCPDCKGKLESIRLLGEENGSIASGIILGHYGLADEKRMLWVGPFPRAGTIAAYRCVECSRIFLYGTPLAE